MLVRNQIKQLKNCVKFFLMCNAYRFLDLPNSGVGPEIQEINVENKEVKKRLKQ